MPRGKPVQMMGIWLRHEGSDVVVFGEDVYGNSIELIREHDQGPFSHNISEHGIRSRFAAACPVDMCPDCKTELEVGFGLAGGGYGPYSFCPDCGTVVSKTQDPT